MKKVLLELRKYVQSVFGLRLVKAKVRARYYDLKKRGW